MSSSSKRAAFSIALDSEEQKSQMTKAIVDFQHANGHEDIGQASTFIRESLIKPFVTKIQKAKDSGLSLDNIQIQ